MQKTVLITGGAGFIGSFLCEALLRDGHRVICIDDFSTGHVRNIESFLRIPDFQLLRLNINEPFDLESFVELEPFQLSITGIQEIYHLACPTAIKTFEAQRENTLLANSVGTQHVLDLAVKYKSKVMLASTSVVYGERSAEKSVFTEEDIGIVDHLTPRAVYDEGKRFAETMFFAYKDVHGIDAKVARIFRTYGPRMPLFDGHQIPDFILAALDNQQIVINGHEEFKTSLLYVVDLIDGLMRFMETESDFGPMNFGSDADMTLADVARKIVEMTGSTSTITFGEQLGFLSELGLPSIQKAKLELGWIPVIRLEDGLKKTIDYIKANKLLLTQQNPLDAAK
jgi:UDP-glucuronate decarboxylase